MAYKLSIVVPANVTPHAPIVRKTRHGICGQLHLAIWHCMDAVALRDREVAHILARQAVEFERTKLKPLNRVCVAASCGWEFHIEPC